MDRSPGVGVGLLHIQGPALTHGILRARSRGSPARDPFMRRPRRPV